ncbi:MAG: hypothetical protein E4H21_04630 [Thermodesulfobacteriales bacterium]|nr:MAG: hypothetical protein E4H21_04630 [Thermodesulfobacteriales bacterium]
MKRIMVLNLIIIFFIFFAAGCGYKKNDPQASNTPESTGQNPHSERLYTFSWQYGENSQLKPRGGTTKGAPVLLDNSENSVWLSIYEPGISKFEQDRRAILAMAGDYRVTFDFIETVPLRGGYKPQNPYQSWATEFVKVIEDSGAFISLQHILVMYVENVQGAIEGPFVAKHWRHDWKYEDNTVLEYIGNNTWRVKTIPSEVSKGKWSQAVYQVDDSPRYEAIGEWIHDGNYSSWTTAGTWRPLPRREFSVRDDYNVLVSGNRHIINENGWVHEQDNIKLVVDESGTPIRENPYLVKEAGLNRYERITDTDFSAGIDYWTNTAEFWEDVRDAWSQLFSQNEIIKLNSKYENKKLYQYLFQYADNLDKGVYDSEEGSKFATSTINNFVIEANDKPDISTY